MSGSRPHVVPVKIPDAQRILALLEGIAEAELVARLTAATAAAEIRRERHREAQRAKRAAWIAEGLTNDGHPRSPSRTLDDIDEVAVQLAVQGQRPALNQGEKRAVVALLTARGASRKDVADALGCSIPNVDRIRKLLRETAA